MANGIKSFLSSNFNQLNGDLAFTNFTVQKSLMSMKKNITVRPPGGV